MKESKDNFSAQSGIYAAHRPGYPPALFDWLFSQCTDFHAAWDCATGNGQAAINIAPRFEIIYATDLSIKQLENSVKADNIDYRVEKAELSTLPDNSVNLITVAQALHWFDHEAFFKEVERVACDNALFAAWGYDLLSVDNGDINKILRHFHDDITGPYWDSERKHVDEHYLNIHIPFEVIDCPLYSYKVGWQVERLIGYLNTWSSVQHYIKVHGNNPVELISEQLRALWGDSEREVSFPIFMKAARIKKNAL